MSVPAPQFCTLVGSLARAHLARLYAEAGSSLALDLPTWVGLLTLQEFGTDGLEVSLCGHNLSTTGIPQDSSQKRLDLGAGFLEGISDLASHLPSGITVWRGRIGINPNDFIPGEPLNPSVYVQIRDDRGKVTWDGFELIDVQHRQGHEVRTYRLRHWRLIESPEVLDPDGRINAVFGTDQPTLREQVDAAGAFVEALVNNPSVPVFGNINYEHTKDGSLHSWVDVDDVLTSDAAADPGVRNQISRRLGFFQNAIEAYALRLGGAGLTVKAISLGPDPEDFIPNTSHRLPETLSVLFVIHNADNLPVESFWLGKDDNGTWRLWVCLTGTVTR